MRTKEDYAKIPRFWFDPQNAGVLQSLIDDVGDYLLKFKSFVQNAKFQDQPLNQMFADVQTDIDQFLKVKLDRTMTPLETSFLMIENLPVIVAKMDALQDRLQLATQHEGKAPGLPRAFKRIADTLLIRLSWFLSSKADPSIV